MPDLDEITVEVAGNRSPKSALSFGQPLHRLMLAAGNLHLHAKEIARLAHRSTDIQIPPRYRSLANACNWPKGEV